MEQAILDGNYGLATDIPLNLESVIKSCFSNPDRRKFEGFPASREFGDLTLHPEERTAEYFIEKAKNRFPQAMVDFNNQQIRLQATSYLYTNFFKNPAKPTVDKEKYLEEIKNSKWHGPYKDDTDDNFVFCTINSSGDNDYLVTLSVTLNENDMQQIFLAYWNHKNWIAEFYSFCE